jgi:hypothetical protein
VIVKTIKNYHEEEKEKRKKHNHEEHEARLQKIKD